MTVASGEIPDIATVIDNKRKREIEENRAALIPIIETVIFSGENVTRNCPSEVISIAVL